jgi:Raf kinase inhibitor-like YbhB/YbcL family protein
MAHKLFEFFMVSRMVKHWIFKKSNFIGQQL